MLQAAIVEDSAVARAAIRDGLDVAFRERQLSVGFDLFSGGDAFLSMYTSHYHYDMLFLDIEMPGLDGFEVCRRVRQIQPDALVVFISSREELVFQSFEVQPFRFIRKSDLENQLGPLADAIATELERRNHRTLRIVEPVSQDIFSFDSRQIKYVEAQRKECVIACVDRSVTVKARFMDIEAMLRGEPFLKVHRSYLVNARYVFHIGKTGLTLTTGEEIPLSRGKADEIRVAFMKLLAEDM